ncbi:phosphodiester glycosidase family protein [Desulfovibrio sp.]|uniref:phosphodiester glycosidase family protein n=1 Tax=Desulfovibrio sp. TaxID=885 RepID=UPI0025B9A8CD|nr:phosphodiester glycosidase family protein [Desulfovibrio sp.]
MTHRTDLYIAGQPAPATPGGTCSTGTGCARTWPRAARVFLANCLFVCCLAAFWQAAEAADTRSPARPDARPAATVDAAAASPVETAAPSDEHTTNPPPPAPGVAAQAPSAAGVDELGKPAWRQLEPGLDFGEFQLTDSEALLTALRIDPAHFDFILCARSQDGGALRSLNQWAEQYGLTAAINASMYLPDGITSTGYMRQNGHYNNKRIVQRFGAFFVAGPDNPELPGAAIVDRDDPQWEQRISQYHLVIQNYRMTSADRRILWSPGGPHYSISAVAQDGDGRILFLHCRQPVEAYAFAQQLLHLPLNVRTVMYVEGGGQAGLLVRSADWKHELAGLSAAGLLVTGDLRAQLPNVLGAVRKAATKNEAATPPADIPTDTSTDTSAATPAALTPPARSDGFDSSDLTEERPKPPAALPSPEEPAGQKAPPQTENN